MVDICNEVWRTGWHTIFEVRTHLNVLKEQSAGRKNAVLETNNFFQKKINQLIKIITKEKEEKEGDCDDDDERLLAVIKH